MRRLLTSTLPFLLLLALYFVAYANPQWRYDTTAAAENTPLPEVVALLNEAASPIEAIAFLGPNSIGRPSTELYLDGLRAASPNFRYEIVDPSLNQTLALTYAAEEGLIVFITNRGTADERTADLYFLGDRDVYAALLQLIYPSQKIAYFVTGHGEPDLFEFDDFGVSEARRQLEDLGFITAPLDLRTSGGVPADADVVALVAPQRALSAEEMAALGDYAAGGGSLFIAADVLPSPEAERAEQAAVAPYLQQTWGLTLRPDILIDPPLTYFEQVFTFIIQDFGQSPIITADVRQFSLLLSAARSIHISPLDEVQVVALLRTSPNAWGETDLNTFPPVQEAADTAGPLVAAVSAEHGAGGGRLVLVSDTDWMLNRGIFSGGNSIFLTNTFNWLAGDEQTLSLTPRETINRTLVLTQAQILSLQIASLTAAPLLFAIFGLYNWFSRRYKR
ncbi:MAG: Gldg family protein [Chloroflexi bacterium]|nr:Gldg family protein [Chloroflexota bacterium]